jgi:SnoaL-like domain
VAEHETASPVQPLPAEDRQAIDDLLAAYVLSLDVDDVEGAVNLFTEDGEFRTHGRVWAGPDRLRRFFGGAPRGLHLAGRSLVAPSPEGAAVRQQLVFYPADRSPHRLAIYDDIVVRSGDRWLFRSRECRFMTANGTLDSNA